LQLSLSDAASPTLVDENSLFALIQAGVAKAAYGQFRVHIKNYDETEGFQAAGCTAADLYNIKAEPLRFEFGSAGTLQI
jgi:hypothetical protein